MTATKSSGIVVSGNEMTGSAQELADRMGVSYGHAQGVLKLLLARNIAKIAGQRANPNGRGAGAVLYTIPTTPVTFTLTKGE